MNHEELQIIRFTCWASFLSVMILIPPGLLVAWLLAKKRWRGKSVIETLIALPMVMPPVATGFILLKIFGGRNPVGRFLEETFGLHIVFTWKAVVIASSVMAFPLFVRVVRTAFEEINPRLELMARTLGANEWRVFFSISLPISIRGVLAGTLLAFARALGEFGATIILAGNIPGETNTISMSIYNAIQLGDDAAATRLLVFSTIIAFLALYISEKVLKRHHLVTA